MCWVQMTGLDVAKEEIMEAAVIVTDSDLNIVAEGPNLVLKVNDETLDNMNDWCKEHHGKVWPVGLQYNCSLNYVLSSSL